MSIVDLTSLFWGAQRYSAVAHSFRVASKSRNLDEMIVGLMHEFYAASSYTRVLYSCDVNGDPAWKEALDLFVWPVRRVSRKVSEEVSDSDLLNCNMPQNLSQSEKEQWLDKETKWSQKYRRWLLRLKDNPIARRVMIYDLEDKLDVLRHPGVYDDTWGPQSFVLPWKKHYAVSVRVGRHGGMVSRIPENDDSLLLRPLTEEERNNLIIKYARAKQLLSIPEDEHPQECDFTQEEMDMNARVLEEGFKQWLSDQEWEKVYCDDEETPFNEEHI